jgi:hypothetical protein
MSQAPFQFDPQLTALANIATNENFIADEALPTIRISQSTYHYLEIPRGQFFRIPDTEIGSDGEPNQVRFTGERKTGSVKGHGLSTPVPRQDQSQAQQDFDPRATNTRATRRLLMLRKEKDMADKVFDDANYAATNKKTLIGAERWSNTASEPIREILTKFDRMAMRPNIGIVGREVATALILHPDILQAFHKNEGGRGVANLEFVANLLGLEALFVGEAWYDENTLGQDVSLARVWGKRAAFLHRSRDVITSSDGAMQILTWGATLLWPVQGQDMAVFRWFDPKPGTEGVDWVKVTTRYNQQLVANDFGFLFIDAVD